MEPEGERITGRILVGALEEDKPFLAGEFGLIGKPGSFQTLAESGRNGIKGNVQNGSTMATI
jgi:hypothetical protein